MGDFFIGFGIGIFLVIATLWIVGVFNTDDEFEDGEEEHDDEQE